MTKSKFRKNNKTIMYLCSFKYFKNSQCQLQNKLPIPEDIYVIVERICISATKYPNSRQPDTIKCEDSYVMKKVFKGYTLKFNDEQIYISKIPGIWCYLEYEEGKPIGSDHEIIRYLIDPVDLIKPELLYLFYLRGYQKNISPLRRDVLIVAYPGSLAFKACKKEKLVELDWYNNKYLKISKDSNGKLVLYRNTCSMVKIFFTPFIDFHKSQFLDIPEIREPQSWTMTNFTKEPEMNTD